MSHRQRLASSSPVRPRPVVLRPLVRESGQATFDYLGITIVVAILIAAMAIRYGGHPSAVDRLLGAIGDGVASALDRMHVS